MSRISVNVAAVEGTIASTTGTLSAAAETAQQHLGAYSKISGDGSGSTVASAQDYGVKTKAVHEQITDAVRQANNIARTTANDAAAIDIRSATRFG